MIQLEQKFEWGGVVKKVKILHCADLHFDTPFKELTKELSDISKEELLEVFSKIIDLVIEEKVQVLLIAGDVFDNITVNKTTLYFIASELGRIKDTYVFISPGNHDPYNNKSFYHMINWPENVYVFKGNMENVEVKELDLIVWGAGFRENHVKEPLIKVESVDKSKINIMVLHGDISNRNSINDYNPIYLEDISISKMDYIALGHRHGYSGILREGNTYYAYCGCPQGRGFDENDSKGVIIGDVHKGGVKLDFQSICKREYIVKEINISDCKTYEQIKDIIMVKFNKDKRNNNLFKIILTGKIEEHLNLKEEVLLQKLKSDFYFIKIVNKTTLQVDIENLANDYSIKGRFVLKMLQKLNEASGEEKEVINAALKLGIQCLSEEEVNLNDY